MLRVLIAAGGTAGHVVPALAVAERLRAAGADVVFVGGERAEARARPGRRLRAAHDPRRGAEPHEPAARRARGCCGPGAAVGAARRILRELRPAAVLGGGGYVAGPGRAGRAARAASRSC